MTKPLFRWTVGNCLQQGLDILAESINRTTRALGIENWDWAICYNGLNRDDLKFLQGVIGNRPIQLVPQHWATCPIPDNCQTPRRKDGSFEWNGNRCGGTMWKVCPPRLRMETHEIVMDNDIVLLKKFPQIDEFLSSNDKALILEEPIRFYGRYDCLFGAEETYLNSGLMGFPPGYDYGSAIYDNWEKYGKYMNLTQADEQGILTYTLNQLPSVRIKKEQMIEVLHRDFKTKLTGHEQGIHFTQANRIPNHHQWQKYQELVSRNSIM
jgi:hypothetical protein